MAYQTDPITGALGGSRLNPFRTWSNYVYPRTIDQKIRIFCVLILFLKLCLITVISMSFNLSLTQILHW